MRSQRFKDSRLAQLGLTGNETEALDHASTLVDVPAGTVLCRQGAPGRQLAFIVDGEAEVSQFGVIVAHVGHGDVVGEGTMLGAHERCSADVVAQSPMRVVVLSRTDWQAASHEAPSLVRRLEAIARTRDEPLAA